MMATIHINNKYEVSFKELIKQTKKKGGAPKDISISPQEAWEILIEMKNSGGGKSDTSFQVKFPDGVNDLMLSKKLWEPGKLELSEAKSIIRKWVANEFSVLFDGIHLRIIVPKKKPEMPPIRYINEDPSIPKTKNWWKLWR